MISVVMNQEGVDLQTAVDFVGNMCKASIDRFNHDRRCLPSWGPKIDKDVAVYVNGLADWIVGSLHWSFETERYFGKAGKTVKATRVVGLLPRRSSCSATSTRKPNTPEPSSLSPAASVISTAPPSTTPSSSRMARSTNTTSASS